MKKITFGSHDFGMFDGEFNGYDYEFFFKHTGAFKRFLKEESKEQKKMFLDAFCEFFQNHGEMKAMSSVKDHKKRFVESFKLYGLDNFVNGKLSAARQFLNDTVMVAKNKHMIQYMDSQSYTKDPFFNKDTRDVFRRLFGEPSESGTCIKVICLLPIYIKFAGSICRYLRRWLEADETPTTLAALKLSSKPQRGKKKEDEKKSKEGEKRLKIEEKLKEAEKSRDWEKKSKEEGKKPKEEEKLKEEKPAIMVFKVDRDGVQEIRRTPSGDHKFTAVNDPAYLEAAGFPWPQLASTFDGFTGIGRSRHEDRELLRNRRRDEQMFNEHDRIMRETQAQMRRLQNKKIEEVLRNDPDMARSRMVVVDNSKDTNFDIKGSQRKTSEDNTSKKTTLKEKTLDSKSSEGKTSKEKTSEENNPKGKPCEEKMVNVETSEGKTLEGKTSQGDISEKMTSELEEKKTAEKQSSNSDTFERKTFEEQISESKTSEGNIPEDNSSKENRLSDGVSVEKCDHDDTADDRLMKEMFPGLHLGEPHPNEVYDNIIEENRKVKMLKNSSENNKLHTCAFCKTPETEPKAFKKCQKCKGKGTKFYCCRSCQKNDWPTHRFQHEN